MLRCDGSKVTKFSFCLLTNLYDVVLDELELLEDESLVSVAEGHLNLLYDYKKK